MKDNQTIRELRAAADQLAKIDDPVAFTLAEVCRGRALILQHETSTPQPCMFCGGERTGIPAHFPCSVTGSHGPHFEREPRRCEAIRESDQMYCRRCHLRWDVNDPEPPECRP